MSCAQLRNNLPQAPSLSKSFRRLFIFFTMLIIAFALDSFIVRAQTTLQAPDSNSFNTALILAHLGDTIVLTAGQTYKDINPLPFKNESCPTNRTCYITIRSSAITSLPASDVRVSPADAVNMPKIITYNSDPALQTASGAGYYNIIGIEIVPQDANVNVDDTLVRLGDPAYTSLGQVPHHIIIDRCYIHAFPNQILKRGIGLHSKDTSIINSYISDFKSQGQDAQAIAGWNGPGPFLIQNNYLEASGENILFGGSIPRINGLIPSDINILGNYLAKPLSWRSAGWQVKNLLELKSAQTVLIEGNIMENSWDPTFGYWAVTMTVRNDSGVWATIRDVTFRNNIVRHAGRGINLLGLDDNNQPSVQGQNITIYNNLFDDINSSWNDDGRWAQVRQMNNVTLDHNTVFQNSNILTLVSENQPSANFTMTNNIVNYAGSGIWGDDGKTGSDALQKYFNNPTGGVVNNNVFIGGISHASQYPSGNDFPALADVGFINYPNHNYQLKDTSQFRTKGVDFSNPNFPLLAPTNLWARPLSYNCDNLQLLWIDNSYNETGFKIERTSLFGPTNWTTYTITGPNIYKFRISESGASTYYYRVSAVNTNWSSTLSNVAWNSYCWSIDNDGGIFEDDFNDDLMDTTKWYKGILSVDTSAYNSGVTVLEQNQRLEIIPIANTSVPSYNGYVSANSYNFIGGRASVQVPQIPTGGTAMAIFTVGIDSNNWYRIATKAGQIYFEDMVNGVKNSANMPYDSIQHQYWQIRHDSERNMIAFETSDDGTSWTVQRTIATNLPLTAMRIELSAGTFESVSEPGIAVFDNFRFDALGGISPLSAPSSLIATGMFTPQVNLTWTASTGGTVDHYRVERCQNIASGYTIVASNVTATSFTDTGVSNGAAYLYRVRAVDSQGYLTNYSNTDLATAMSFTDDPLLAGITPIKAQHIAELRQAVNAVRALANLSVTTWTYTVQPGVVIHAVDVQELRANLDEARSALYLSAVSYSDQPLTAGSTPIKKGHLEELRQGVK